MAPAIKSLVVACETLLAGDEHVKSENCLKLWSYAQKYNCFVRLMHATSSLIAKNLADMAKNDEFLHLPFDNLAKLLLSESMRTADPDQRCHAAISWLNYDRIGRASFVKDIVGMVPLTYGFVSASAMYEAHESEMLREHAPDTIRNFTSGILKRMVASTTSDYFNGGSCCPNWYLVGGQGEQRNSFMHYHASHRCWSKLRELPWGRQGAAATVIGNRLKVLGGGKNGQATDDIDEYDFSTGSWTTVSAKLSVARSLLTACSVGQQTFVIGGDIGGNEAVDVVEKFDAESGRITCVAPMALKRSNPAVVSSRACNHNSVFVAGGFFEDMEIFEGSIEKYDICTDRWTKVGQTNDHRENFAGALSGDDFYLVGGSFEGDDLLASMEIFNIRTGQIRTAHNLPHKRMGGSGTTLCNGNLVCVVGGFGAHFEVLREVQCYDTREGKWSTGTIVPDMPQAVNCFGFAAL